MERPIVDFCYIYVDKLFEDETEGGLFIDTEDYVSEEDPDRVKQQHRRIYGTVIRTPRMLDDTKLTLKDPGLPWPKRGITGEFIENQVKTNPRAKWGAHNYSCASFEPEFVKLSDFPMIAREGDKVYVHYDAFDKPLAEKVFLVRYDSIICVVRDGEILMATDHNLITPKLMEGQDIESLAGLLLMIGKDNPVPLRGYEMNGTEIVYMPDADWINRIEGKDYYVVKTQDILMEINGKKAKPRGNRVIVSYDKAKAETEGGLLVPEMTQLKEKATTGIVVEVGPDVEDLQVGDEIVFAAGSGTIVDEWLVLRDTDIFATL